MKEGKEKTSFSFSFCSLCKKILPQAAVKEKMETAAGYFEKALRLKPTDKALMQALQTAYSKAGRVSDAACMQERLNALKWLH